MPAAPRSVGRAARDRCTESLVVALGAVVGATSRWGIGELVTTRPRGLPLATTLVNLTGCLLAGLAASRLRRGSLAWLALVTGVLGGFTTFSAFAVDVRGLLADDQPGVALAYAATSVAGGLAAAALARRAPA